MYLCEEHKNNTFTKNNMCECLHCDYEVPQYFMNWHHRSIRKICNIKKDKAAKIREVPLCRSCVGESLAYI